MRTEIYDRMLRAVPMPKSTMPSHQGLFVAHVIDTDSLRCMIVEILPWSLQFQDGLSDVRQAGLYGCA